MRFSSPLPPMKLHAVLLIIGGLVTGCQHTAFSADNPDTRVMNFMGVFDGDAPDSPAYLHLISINAAKGEVVYDYNSSSKYPPCEEVGRFICVWGSQINIMIPKDWASNEGAWAFRSVRFRVVDKFYDGHEVSDILVEARDRDEKLYPTYYLYSFKRGLVSFRLDYSGGPGTPPDPVVFSRLW